MEIDILTKLLYAILFTVYAATSFLSLIFALSLDTFMQIESKFYFEILSSPAVNVLDTKIDKVDVWLKENNAITGFLLTAFSVAEIVVFYNIIRILHLK